MRATGWPATLSDEDILHKLVELNSVRDREEQAGQVRWLRPAFRKSAGVQAQLEIGEDQTAPTTAPQKVIKRPWPKTLPEQAAAIRTALAAQPGVVTAEKLAKSFSRARTETVNSLLQTLVSLGLVREVKAEEFAV